MKSVPAYYYGADLQHYGTYLSSLPQPPFCTFERILPGNAQTAEAVSHQTFGTAFEHGCMVWTYGMNSSLISLAFKPKISGHSCVASGANAKG